MDNMKTQELISALADGHLQGEDLDRALAAAAADPSDWHAYHVIGDALRSPELAAGAASGAQFVARLRGSLKGERPSAAAVRPILELPQPADIDTRAPAANDSHRWKLVAGFASLAAVAAIGWNLMGVAAPGAAGPQLASAPAGQTPQAVMATSAPQGPMLRDERLDRLLAAHRQLGATALQQPTGFLRNATFEGPAR